MEITDAYAHCGIRRFRPLEQLNPVMDRFGVKRAVLAQHMREFDNSYIEVIVAHNPGRFAGVFLVDLEGPSAVDDARKWTERGRFRGIRLPVESLATHGELWRWCAQLGLNFVLYGTFSEENVRRLGRFAADHPGNAIQVAHLGFPVMEEAPGFNGLRPFLALAERRNVLVQVSGFHQLSKPPYEDLVPVVQLLYRTFGRERLVYGSNYPVMERDEVYGLEIELLSTGKLGIPREAVPAVMHENAYRTWFDRSRIRAGSLLWSLSRPTSA
jgi:predicted TIM-barrel fold metal-dependent hydrolase